MKGGLFDCIQETPYPPFMHGLYLEEYCVRRYTAENPILKRTYIPLKWTNFQIHRDYNKQRHILQKALNIWVHKNPNPNGYFTIVQHDDGPTLSLPKNTIIYGACGGSYKIPLIYEDVNNRLINMKRKTFSEKEILCSFIGTLTHNVRCQMQKALTGKPGFHLNAHKTWNINVSSSNQDIFINNTINSKFALAPRGYGRSSFRFFEIFQLGSIPIYIWDDIEWLPYKDKIDYNKFCISIHISQIDTLEQLLHSIDEVKYNQMLEEYETVKHMFAYEYMYNYIMEHVNNN